MLLYLDRFLHVVEPSVEARGVDGDDRPDLVLERKSTACPSADGAVTIVHKAEGYTMPTPYVVANAPATPGCSLISPGRRAIGCIVQGYSTSVRASPESPQLSSTRGVDSAGLLVRGGGSAGLFGG